MRWLLCTLPLVVTPSLGWLLPLAANASDEVDAPKLTIAQTTVQLQVERDKFFQDRTDTGQAVGSLLIANQGTAPATGMAIAGMYADGTPFTLDIRLDGETTPAPITIAPNESAIVDVSIDWAHDDSPTGLLIVTAMSGSPPATVPFQIKESLPGTVFVSVLIWSAIVAALVCLAAHAALRLGARPDNTSRPRFADRIGPVATWTFAGSWASNLTALGAILGTVLATTGFLTDVVPGLSTGLFAAMSLLFVFLVLVAPVVYLALHDNNGEPTYVGLLIAAGFTVWAAIGELAAAAQLITRAALGPTAQIWPWVLVVLLILTLGAYTRSSIAQVLKRKKARSRAKDTAKAVAQSKAREAGIDIPLPSLDQVLTPALEVIDTPGEVPMLTARTRAEELGLDIPDAALEQAIDAAKALSDVQRNATAML